MKSKLPTFLTSPWFLIFIAAIVVGQIVFMTLNKSQTPATVTSSTTPATTSPASPSYSANNTIPSVTPNGNNKASTPNIVVGQTPAATVSEDLEPWEKDLDAALDDNLSDEQSVGKILALYPTFPEDGKIEAVEYLVDLVEDKDYSKIEPLLYDTKAPEEVLDTLMDDLYGREEYVQLPAMLKIMQNPSSPLYQDAKENLADYLEEDYGNDMAKWDAGVKKYLQENPPEPDDDNDEESE